MWGLMTQKKLLIVDDEDDLRYLMAEYFYEQNFNVSLAADGQEALEMYTNQSYDLIVTDVRMPKMNGLQLLKAIKTNNPKFPVILMTGFELSKSDIANIRYPADAYITKPFQMDYMKRIIDTLLAK